MVKAEIRRQKACLLVCRKCCVCGPAAQIHHLVQPALAYLDTVRTQLHHDSEDSNLNPKGMRRFVGSAPLIFLCWKTSSKPIAKKGYLKLSAVDDIWIRDLCAEGIEPNPGPSSEQCKLWPAQSKLGIFTRLVKAKVDMDCFQGHGIKKEFPALVTSRIFKPHSHNREGVMVAGRARDGYKLQTTNIFERCFHSVQ